MVWPAVIAGGASLIGGAVSGKQSAQDSSKARQQQEAMTRLGLYANSPREEVLPFIDQNLGDVHKQFQERQQQYYGLADSSEGLEMAIQQGLFGEQSGRDTIDTFGRELQYAQDTGRFNLDPNSISSVANQLLNAGLIDSQVDAYGRDIARNLGENQITGIRAADVATGNLGSSRGGVQEAIARRSAEDRIADFRGSLTANALQQAQGIQSQNIDTNLGLMGQMFNVGQAQMAHDTSRVQDMANLGAMQQQIAQNRIDNMSGARDYELEGLLQYGNFLTGQANIGNLVHA